MVEVEDLGLVGLVREQQRLHRNLGIQDVYTFLFQGVMGVVHVLADKDQAKRWPVDGHD